MQRESCQRPVTSDTVLHNILDALPVAMIVLNAASEITLFNRAAQQLFGVITESGAVRQCGDFLRCVNRLRSEQGCGHAPGCKQCPLCNRLQAVLAGNPTAADLDEGESFITRDPGLGPLWIRYSFRPLTVDGQPSALFTVVDTTSQRRSEQQYQMLFLEMFNGFALHEIICDSRGNPIDYRFLTVNPAFERMTGLYADQVVGRTVREVLPNIESHWIETYGRVALTGQPVHFEHYSAGLDMHFSISAYRTQPGQFACLFEDLTERKRQEQELQTRMDRARKLVAIYQYPARDVRDLLDHALEQAIQLTDSAIGYIYRYHEGRKILTLDAWSKEVLPACAITDPPTVFHLDKTGIWGEAIRQRRPVVINDFQAPHPLKRGYPPGHVALQTFMTVPIFFEGRIVCLVGLANKEGGYSETEVLQVTLLMESVWTLAERKSMEEEHQRLHTQLLQAQKLEAIGTLAGGIAHDFNNILGAVLGYAQMAKEHTLPTSPATRNLDRVMEAGNRAAALVKQILAFSRHSASERHVLNPQLIVREALKFLRPSLPATILIKPHILATRPILADPTQLHQILMNLCTNAFHAMESTGGTLEITLRDQAPSPDELSRSPEVVPGEFVLLIVSDTGPGIPPEIQDRIFDPYFTTKGVGQGTGLGLSITHGIVAEYGGLITCDSKPGRGATFRVYFPAVDTTPSSESKHVKEVSIGQEHILLVDDEAILAEVGQFMLERLGYTVTTCTSSIEALSLFEADPDRFDAVITDQTMPQLTGIELATRMLALRPQLPVILCTGYSNLINEEEAKARGIKGFALKPMVKNQMAALLREVLDARA